MNQVCICKKDGSTKKSEKARYYKESSLLFYIKNGLLFFLEKTPYLITRDIGQSLLN